MAVTIVETAGGASSNSYVTLAEANTFMESRLNASSWETDATDDEKNRALVEAQRYLTRLSWCGDRVTDTQALAWPRQWAVDPDNPVQDYYDSTEIPQRVKDAQMELAFQFIKGGTTDVAALDAQAGIKRKKIDVIETEYDTVRRPVGLGAYPSVMRHIRPLLDPVGPYSAHTVRG